MRFFAGKILMAITLCCVLAGFGGPALAQEQFPIEITSDKLMSNPTEQYVEFLGNVRVLYEGFKINANTLRIYYEQKAESNDDPLAMSGIKSLLATGNVTIVSPDYDIKAERADYNLKTGMATFTGKEVKVTQDKNTITGTKITLNRNEGRINVEGDQDTRIKAIFYTDEKLDTSF